MATIHEMLEKLRLQRGAMLEGKSTQILNAFLLGFALAARKKEDPEPGAFLERFNHWVRKRFRWESGTQGWAKIIAFHSADEADQWNKFWELYDEFMEKANKSRSRVRA